MPQDIKAFLDQWVHAWRTLDTALMVSLFDDGYRGPLYLAEENPEFLHNAAEVGDYWLRSNALVSLRMEMFDFAVEPEITLLSPEVAIVGVIVDSHLILRALPQGVVGPLRGSLVLRRSSEGRWRIVHYHESRQLLLGPAPDDSYQFLVNAHLGPSNNQQI